MTSQAQIQDEILAKRLQDMEFQEHRRALEEQNRADEELARRLAMEDQSQPAQQGGGRALQPGQMMQVRLHHPITMRQIGETLLASYMSHNNMVFELAATRGKYLRCSHSGGVEFSPLKDNSATFVVETLPGGSLYLLCKNHMYSTNRFGTTGWYLMMSADGQLACNGCRNEMSQWALIAAPAAGAAAAPVPAPQPAVAQSPPQPPTEHLDNAENPLHAASRPPAAAAPAAAAVAAASPQRQAVHHETVVSGAPVTFPGVSAGRETLMKFFMTPIGIDFLKQPEYEPSYRLYTAGLLPKILHRPDWPQLAHRYQDLTKATITYDESLVFSCVNTENIRAFFETGFVVLPGVIPSARIQHVNRLMSYWLVHNMNSSSASECFMKKGERVEYTGAIASDVDVLSLYYDSPIYHIVQKLIGPGDVALPTLGRIVQTFPTLDQGEVRKYEESNLSDKWIIQGFDGKGGHSPYNLLVGIALSDITRPLNGNFCVHPGSQMLLMEAYKQQVLSRSTLYSDDPFLYKKPDLGDPRPLMLNAGDVFLCTQRLAYQNSPNIFPEPTSILYFRVSHVDHEIFKEPALDGIWLEFRESQNYLADDSLYNHPPAPPAATAKHHQEGTLLDMTPPPPVVPANDALWKTLPSEPEFAPSVATTASPVAAPVQATAAPTTTAAVGSTPFDDFLSFEEVPPANDAHPPAQDSSPIHISLPGKSPHKANTHTPHSQGSTGSVPPTEIEMDTFPKPAMVSNNKNNVSSNVTEY